MAKDPYRTVKINPDVASMLDRAKHALEAQLERKVTVTGAVELLVRHWAETAQMADVMRGQVLAESGVPCGLPDSHLAHVWRARDGRWWHCDGRVVV